eukprot:4780297-Amphidinium_carterae.1
MYENNSLQGLVQVCVVLVRHAWADWPEKRQSSQPRGSDAMGWRGTVRRNMAVVARTGQSVEVHKAVATAAHPCDNPEASTCKAKCTVRRSATGACR